LAVREIQSLVASTNPSAGEDRALNISREREEATREILEIISRSRDDEKPVFDTILRNALRLCKVDMSVLAMLNEEGTHLELSASAGAQFVKLKPGEELWPVDGDLTVARAVRERRNIVTEDLRDDELYRRGDPTRVALVDQEGMRSQLVIPLLNGERAIGSFVLQRRKKQSFTQDEISLLQSFAAQAVIAIENVRQFRAIQTANAELETRLEREAATRSVLEVISRSRDDEEPVFNVILENAARLCEAPLAYLRLIDEEAMSLAMVAHHGTSEAFIETVRANPLSLDAKDSDTARAVRERRVVHIEDLAAGEPYRTRQAHRVHAVETEGMRTLLLVPLLSGEACLGVISLYRREVKPFTPAQIALVETFATQAVIAIDNVRQFRAIQTANAELETRLEREAATRGILEVISRSRDDEGPVFDVILENAARLCNSPMARLHLVSDDRTSFRSVAFWGDPMRSMAVGESWPLDPSNPLARAMIDGQTLHMVDHADTEWYRSGDPTAVRLVEVEGIRTRLSVPLIQGDIAIGAITLSRREVEPFAEGQIALVETFAAQAVIAIENVRQFREIQTLNTTLEARVEAQIGEIERMGRLKRFLPPAVADAVVSSGSEAMLKSHRALIGILFADIRGFTAFCEQAEPEETIEVLQTYHEEMGTLISEHAAGVDHRSGDGIMLIFNDPLPCDDPAGEAVRLAVAMRVRMAELCRDWLKLGHRLGFGVGISLGYATVGMVGSEGRYEYTASGTAVNLAARLCERAADGEILLSPRAFASVEEEVEWEPAGQLELKGLAAPVEVRKVRGFARKPNSKKK
jgi:class 3 adenylate cyclase